MTVRRFVINHCVLTENKLLERIKHFISYTDVNEIGEIRCYFPLDPGYFNFKFKANSGYLGLDWYSEAIDKKQHLILLKKFPHKTLSDNPNQTSRYGSNNYDCNTTIVDSSDPFIKDVVDALKRKVREPQVLLTRRKIFDNVVASVRGNVVAALVAAVATVALTLLLAAVTAAVRIISHTK